MLPSRAVCLAFAMMFVGTALAKDASAQPAASTAQRERLSLDRGWRFNLGDIPFPVISGHDQSYNNAKAGTTGGAAAGDYDDSGWRTLDLPHDWAVEQPIDQKANLSQGFHPRGFAWYRRAFKLEPSDRGKHLELQFDGVSTYCTVWVNGLVAARNWCGYTSFKIDLTPFARYGDDLNTIAVRVDAEAQEGWWYEGAGMYRHTWLVKRNPVHITTDGVYANPVRGDAGAWSIPAEVTLFNSGKDDAAVTVNVSVQDSEGKEVAKGSADASVAALDEITAKLSIPVDAPKLWSVDQPTLYTVRTTVARGDQVLDTADTHVGFRTIRFDAKTGFYLNDQPLKLKGVCNHQDHAGVGVAVPDALWEFRIRKLKEMGGNAYRCAHNPPAAEFLDACDRMGLLVMDENRNFNTTDEYVRQLEWLVRRDRNRPSVILWSVFNEEPFQGTEQGYEMVRRMHAVVKRLDASRPVTAAQSNSTMNPVNASQAADVAGFNYQHGGYDKYHEKYPDKPMTSSEDTSAVMTRGEYETDKRARFIIESYDTQRQNWGATHRVAWKMIDQRPFIAGGFVWTGFDYRGEPQPLVWPSTGSSFGIMDQCGFPKAAYYLHQAMWMKDRPILHLIPHWNWAGREGKPVKVMAISNADEVELFLNGKSIERKKSDPYDMVEFQVPYAPGKLEAVSFKGGTEVARFAVETTGEPAALELVADRAAFAGDGRDAQSVTVRAVDVQGRVVPTAKPLATFAVTGPGTIIGVGNGDPICHEPDKASVRSLYNGLAAVIVQSTRDGNGPLTLTATADGLKSATLTIDVKPAPATPSVDIASRTFLVQRWRMSPVTNTPPDPNAPVSNTDMNTWGNTYAGKVQTFTGGRFAMFRAIVKPPAAVRRDGGTLVFKNVTGKAAVWLDGKQVATKDNPAPAALRVPLAPGEPDRTVVVVIEASAPDQGAGLSGVVSVE